MSARPAGWPALDGEWPATLDIQLAAAARRLLGLERHAQRRVQALAPEEAR